MESTSIQKLVANSNIAACTVKKYFIEDKAPKECSRIQRDRHSDKKKARDRILLPGNGPTYESFRGTCLEVCRMLSLLCQSA